MEIIWDEPKRLANLDKHGMDFRRLDEDFFYAAAIFPSKRERYMAIGRLEGRTLTVIFARLGNEGIAIISMRVASPKERKLL
jgi:uncharacterized DUF497 family protein